MVLPGDTLAPVALCIEDGLRRWWHRLRDAVDDHVSGARDSGGSCDRRADVDGRRNPGALQERPGPISYGDSSNEPDAR